VSCKGPESSRGASGCGDRSHSSRASAQGPHRSILGRVPASSPAVSIVDIGPSIWARQRSQVIVVVRTSVVLGVLAGQVGSVGFFLDGGACLDGERSSEGKDFLDPPAAQVDAGPDDGRDIVGTGDGTAPGAGPALGPVLEGGRGPDPARPGRPPRGGLVSGV